MLSLKIKLNHFGSLFYAESSHHKFPKFFEENPQKKNKKKTYTKIYSLIKSLLNY